MPRNLSTIKGFTIVELIVIIAVIAILVTMTVIGYNAVTNNANQEALKTDTQTIASQLTQYKAKHGSYPASLDDLADGPATKSEFAYTYNAINGRYCVTATYKTGTVHIVSGNAKPLDGECTEDDTGGSSTAIQAVTSANCPSTRTRVFDARDNRSYWVQKLADNKCWMLTNLAYAGGGTDTYGDVMPIGDGTAGTLNGPDNTGATSYTLAKYYTPAGSNATTEPTNPSTATTGTGQYGNLYNWCAAMKGQATAACTNTSTPTPNAAVSICPAGWRLPTGGTGAEIAALNTAVNSGVMNTDAGLIASPWLGQRNGYWYGGFSNVGDSGYYWSSTPNTNTTSYYLVFGNTYAYPTYTYMKVSGFAVRCVAS